MPSRVLYHCPCSTGSSPHVGSTIASSSLHQLPSLYFCEECDSIRCNLCTQNEVAVYYCPSCLFDVPAAGIKSEKSRCARNCFQCPVCANILSVTPSDLGGGGSSSAHDLNDALASSSTALDDDWNPRSSQASIGEPPYYLTCSVCRWDSKEIGMVFEKSTGLSLQVQRHEEAAEDVTEFNHLRSHFDAYLRITSEHQQQQQSSTAQSTAVRSSKLFRDLPSLANDPVFLQRRNKLPKAEAVEELKPYIPTFVLKDTERAGQRRADGTGEELTKGRKSNSVSNREFLAEQEDEMYVSSLTERWQSLADQSIRAAELRPNRVPLKTKQTKRCPACRHIIIKAEPKAQSSRYKIKLMALNYLPEIQINPLLPLGSSMATLEGRRRGSAFLGGRRRDLGAVKIDEENLHPGRTYLFEASFVNPLDDAMTITLHIAKNASPTISREADVVQDSDISPSKRQAMREAAEWSVTPTTSTFPVSAFNEVWELDQEDNDLIDAVSKNSSSRGQSEMRAADDVDDDDELDDEFDDALDEDHFFQKSKTEAERKKKGDGILRRRGHETTIGLELALGRSVPRGEIQFAMQVTYRYLPGAAEEQQWSKGENTKSFSFWTVVRLGRVSSEGTRVTASGMPSLTAEARRSALDQRRSIMGINVQQTGAISSTMPSLREYGNV